MNVQEIVTKHTLTHYGNLVRAGEPQFDSRRKLWIVELFSDYPIVIQDDLESKRKLYFMKIKPLGFLVFNEQMRLNRDLTTTREKVVSRLSEYLHQWRSYAERLLMAASSDRIARLPEVATALNPVYEILLALYEDGQARLSDFISSRSSKREMKIRQYFALLGEMGFLRSYEDGFAPGNAFTSILETTSSFDDLTLAVFSEILKHRYSYLRNVVSLGNLERIVRIANIVYYDEIHTQAAIPRSRETLRSQFQLEYGTTISLNSIRTNLYKLHRVDVVRRTKNLYHGVGSVRKKMLELESQIPSPDKVWSIPQVWTEDT
ncbi:MAG: hypothetical protein ACTSVD_08105 [Candidatus Thorarchaeota archaeon]